MIAQLKAGELHEESLVSIQVQPGAFIAYPQLLPHLIVEVFEQQLAGLRHGFVDLGAEFTLE